MKNLTLLALLLSVAAVAQKSPIKYGDIPLEDLKMTTYALDSSASSVVLTDFGVAYIFVTNDGAQMKFERHTRIKILKKEGLGQADNSISLYRSGSDEEKISGLKAASYNLEGGKIVETKMSKEGVFKEEVNKNFNRQKFTIPNVKEGSVIEYTYTKTSDFITSFPNWVFQRESPTRWSEYWAMLPDVFVFEKYMQGYVPPTSYEAKPMRYFDEEVRAHHWITKNVPAFKEEPYMTSEEDYISKINFALSKINYTTYTKDVMGSWAKLNESLLASDAFGKIISGEGFLKEKATMLTADAADEREKVKRIVDYVKENVEYNDDEDFLAYPLKKVLEKKKGSAGDINLLLASMLNKAGVPVDMVILSTRDHGFIREQYPMRSQFNYVVCAVKLDDKVVLLDATEKYLPYDLIPGRCLNGKGLVISATNHGWIEIVPKAKARTIISADMALGPDGELKGKLTYAREGYDAQEMRESYFKKGEQAYVKDILAGKQWQVEKTTFTDLKDPGKQAQEVHNINIAEHTTSAGDIIYLNPFVTSQIDENPFKAETREYPINFGVPSDLTYMLKVTIPDGYVVDEMPKPRMIALPAGGGKYLYNSAQTGNLLTITSSFQINKIFFPQTDYPILKEFYNQVVAKQAEQIVIKKKQ